MKPPSLLPRHFLNRELSWLAFNQRVLEEAQDPTVPLLERVKFFAIVSSNLDEFFEVRVAGLKQQIEARVTERTVDGFTPKQLFAAVRQRVRQLVRDQYRCWAQELRPALKSHGFHFLRMDQLDESARNWVSAFYRTEVRPALTPLAVDAAHPFPQLLNKSLNLVVALAGSSRGRNARHLAVVQVPRVLPRLVRLPQPNGRRGYVLLAELIGHFLGDLFPGMQILGYWRFRVTRNSELYIDDEEVANLLAAVENELQRRRRGDAVRLEVERACPVAVRADLLKRLRLTEEDLHVLDGPLSPGYLLQLTESEAPPGLRYPAFVAPVAKPLQGEPDLFDVIRRQDVLLHHPYDNFESVVQFLQQAAEDPKVLAIKQTLYRTGGDPRIVGALMDAVKNGKQVAAVVELRARFDEADNIKWARRLEEAGVHVVYGLVGYKIHAKATLVVRRDADQIRRYVHLATGNYNPTTARLYTDVGLFTCHPEFGEDVTSLFNLLTGICQFQPLKQLIVAPFDLHPRLFAMIEREADNARSGLPARIIAKMNALVDPRIIEALYRASNAGVKIDLIVRGVCCLRPGVKGLSTNITVRSIVDRFLEHSRIFYFENACQPRVFLASADWMPRNFFRRIETVFPILDGRLSERITSELLALALQDNQRARELQPNGAYRRARAGRMVPGRRSQFEFIQRAQDGIGQPAANGAQRARLPRVKLAPRPF